MYGNYYWNEVTEISRGSSGIPNYGWFSSCPNIVTISSNGEYSRFVAQGLESKTSPITNINYTATSRFVINLQSLQITKVSASVLATVVNLISLPYSNISIPSSSFCYSVINQYSMAVACFDDYENTVLRKFIYVGWLRDPKYVGSTALRGFVSLEITQNSSNLYRILMEDSAVYEQISPLNTRRLFIEDLCLDACVKDFSNGYLGKLYNCIELPANTAIGEYCENIGRDADSMVDEPRFYLCVGNWGVNKLGMRINFKNG